MKVCAGIHLKALALEECCGSRSTPYGQDIPLLEKIAVEQVLSWQSQSCELEKVAQSTQIGKPPVQYFYILIEMLRSKNIDLLASGKPGLGEQG